MEPAPCISPGQAAAQAPASGAPQAGSYAADPTVYRPPTAFAAPPPVPAVKTGKGINSPFALIAGAAALLAFAAHLGMGVALRYNYLSVLEILALVITAFLASKQIRLTALPVLLHFAAIVMTAYRIMRQLGTGSGFTPVYFLRSQALFLVPFLLFLIAVLADGKARQVFGVLAVAGYAIILVSVLSSFVGTYSMQHSPDRYTLLSMLVSIFAYLSYLVLSVGVFCMRNREKASA